MSTVEFIESFKKTLEELLSLYESKNHDYGDSIVKNLNSYDIAFASYLFRIKEKIDRCLTLTSNKPKVDESILDTIKDVANYAIILTTWLELNKPNSDAKE